MAPDGIEEVTADVEQSDRREPVDDVAVSHQVITVEAELGPGPAQARSLAMCCYSKDEEQRVPLLADKDAEAQGEEAVAMVAQKSTEQIFVEKLRTDLNERRTLALAANWASRTVPFYAEIVILVGAAFYADVILDAQAIFIFYRKEQWKYMMTNILAIGLANAYSLIDMLKKVPSSDPPWVMLAIGYLTPINLHILVLCFYSMWTGKKHVLLECAKLAEAAVEAFIASLVQAYALIYTKWKQDEWIAMSLSICSSFFSIGYAFACFDKVDAGLNGVPGRLKGFSFTLLLLLACRVSEVASRISSLAVFGVVTKDMIDRSHFKRLPWVEKNLVDDFLLCGTPGLLLLDFVVLLVLILVYQRKNLMNFIYAIPSLLCFVNPLLECGNPFSIPAHVYYWWRAAELGLMVSLAFYCHSFEELQKKLHNDTIILEFSVVVTAIWMLMVPMFRWFLTEHVIFSYTPSMINRGLLKRSQVLLKDELMRSDFVMEVPEGKAGHSGAEGPESMTCRERMRRVNFQMVAEAVRCLHAAIAAERDRKKVTKTLALDGKDKARKSKAGGAEKKQDGSGVDATDGAEEKQEESDPQVDPEAVYIEEVLQETLFPSLYTWGRRLHQQFKEDEERESDVEEMLVRLLYTGANLISSDPDLYRREGTSEEKEHKEMHMNFLDALIAAIAMRRQTALIHLRTAVEVLPTWKEWSTEGLDRNDFKLHEAKWRIIELLGCEGWLSRDFDTSGDVHVLFGALDTRLAHTCPSEMAFSQWKLCAIAQMRTLATLWLEIPSRSTTKGEVDIDPDYLETFRRDVEWEAMREGATYILDEMAGNSAQAWENKDLQRYCAAVKKGESAGITIVGSALILDQVQKSGLKRVEDRNTAFQAELQKVKDSADLNTIQKLRKGALKHLQDALSTIHKENKENWASSVDDAVAVAGAEAVQKIEEMEELEKDRIKKRAEEAADKKVADREKKRIKEEEKKRKEEDRKARAEKEAMEKALRKEKGEAEKLRREAATIVESLKKETSMLKQRCQVLKNQGMIVLATITEDIVKFFAQLLRDKEALEASLAEWLELPEQGVEVEDGTPYVEGVLTTQAELTESLKNEEWAKLTASKGESFKIDDDLTVEILEVSKAKRQFSLKQSGMIGGCLMDVLLQKGLLLTELATHLDFDKEKLKSACKLSVVDVSGKMILQVMISIREFIAELVEEQRDCELSLSNLRCTLSLHDEDDLHSSKSDDSEEELTESDEEDEEEDEDDF